MKTSSLETSTVKKTKGEKDTVNTLFTMKASAPMGLKIMPENWKIGFLLGAEPVIEWKIRTDWDGTQKYKNPVVTTTTVTNGTETTTTTGGDYTTNSATKKNEMQFSWGMGEKHSIGITVPFGNGAHLDAKMNGSLLNIEGFTIQVFIPLGTPKKASLAE